MTVSPLSDRRRLRIAGIAALVAGLGFLPQPLLIFVLPAPDGAEFFPADRMPELYARATIQAVTWGVFSSALIVAVVAIACVARPTLWSRIGAVFGLIGGAAWLIESASRLGPRAGGVVDHLADAGVSEQIQGAILYLLDVVDLGWTALGAIAVGVWFLMLATSGTSPFRSRVVRAVAGIVGAFQIVATYAFPLPIGGFAIFALLIVLGIALLVTTRRGAVRGQATEVPASSETDAAPAANPSA